MVELSAKQKERLGEIKAARGCYIQGNLDESLGRHVRQQAEKGELDAIGLELEWWNRRVAPRKEES